MKFGGQMLRIYEILRGVFHTFYGMNYCGHKKIWTNYMKGRQILTAFENSTQPTTVRYK